jgi:hypothetical protein
MQRCHRRIGGTDPPRGGLLRLVGSYGQSRGHRLSGWVALTQPKVSPAPAGATITEPKAVMTVIVNWDTPLRRTQPSALRAADPDWQARPAKSAGTPSVASHHQRRQVPG